MIYCYHLETNLLVEQFTNYKFINEVAKLNRYFYRNKLM